MTGTANSPSPGPEPAPAATRRRTGQTADREPTTEPTAEPTDVRPDEPDLGRRLRGLVEANLAVTANLTLREVLTQIVESARTLLDSTYAALGVLGPDGRLVQFLHSGMDSAAAARLGDLPRGHGILGLLVADPRPLRLPDLGRHPASSGFPTGHPPMGSFIGVPIRVHDRVFGNIYLTDKRSGGSFTAQDEELLVALAANAAVAVDHARLHDEAARIDQWRAAIARITTALLSEADDGDVLRMVMSEGRRLVDADEVHVNRHGGDHDETLRPIGIVSDDGHRVITAGVPADPAGSPAAGRVMSVPLVVDGDAAAEVLVVSRRPHRPPFDLDERETITRFSEQVALALARARARADRERVRAVAEHHRIARDMHDHVISRLVGSGLAVQGLTRFITDEAGRSRLASHLDDLDATVRDLRTLIYGLDRDPAVVWSLAARVRQVVDEVAAHLGFTPDVTVDVVVDLPAGSAVPDHLLGVLREALANVVRHAFADSVQVQVRCDHREVTLSVTDNGTGVPAHDRPVTAAGGHGVTNMADRASALGGTFSLRPNASAGVTVCWTVPAR